MTFAHQQLRSYVNRVTRINDDIKSLNSDKSEVYKEAKGNGFDPKVLKAAVKRYTQLQEDRLGVEEFDAILELYMEALLGSGASDDQGGAKSPPAASASPAIGIVKSPTRVHAREPLPLHDEDGVIIEPSEAINGGSAAVVSEVGTGSSEVSAQLANVRPAPAPDLSDNDAQREATVKTTSPAPAAESPASSQEPCSHGSGAVQDRCESTAPPIPSDPRPPQASDGRLTKQETGDPAGSGAASAGFLITGKSPDPSHQFPCEANGWAGLEPLPQFDRRRPAA